MANNKGILTIIAVVLIAILGVLLYNSHQRENASVVDTITSNVNEAAEEVQDEIDDHTTSSQ